MGDSDTKELILSSTFDAIQKVEPFVDELKNRISLDNDDYDRILLATNEAVNNAIIHGNNEDPNKKVRISSNVEEHQLKICVGDEGPGFDPEDCPNPLDDENLLKESGRGVFLIKESADEVYYSRDDNQLVMTFELNDQ